MLNNMYYMKKIFNVLGKAFVINYLSGIAFSLLIFFLFWIDDLFALHTGIKVVITVVLIMLLANATVKLGKEIINVIKSNKK